MIVMKGVVGPPVYVTATGFNRTIGELEEVQVSSGKMVMAQVVSSAQAFARVASVSGTVVTLYLCGPTETSGISLSGASWNSASAVFSTVEIALLADGY